MHFISLSGAFGPSHAPSFECTVKVRGWEFVGSGSTKKEAKTSAAQAALKYLHGVQSVDPQTGKPPAFADISMWGRGGGGGREFIPL